ncbi:putative phage abortive infection protein [Flavobacterium restrictum]|uniref:Phage abortive infection protein n=1 Tax=Flavobacterium restrictum TaxID=2594428 RepID=A0A553E228_9FLAO|nr:putative phage abortive infection protein [Flavobacterium restrictum]TRX39040.1 hypothetical protein FNW21_10640 [Flavobacterium restrictum]
MEENYGEEHTPLERSEFNKNFMVFGAISSTFFGIVILIYYICKVTQSHSLPKEGQILNLTNFGAFGDFIGGFIGTLFSLAGIFFLYLTLKEQRENFNKERLENNFFEMIKFHRENVNELQFSYYENKETKVTAEKRKVFKIIYSQFKELWEELNSVFKNTEIEGIYSTTYLNEVKAKNIFKDYKQLAQIDIVYLIVFFGLGKEDIITIKTLFKNKYKEQFLENIILIAILKPKRESKYWNQWIRINDINDFGIKCEIIKSFYEQRDDNLKLNPINDLFLNPQGKTVFYNDYYEKYYGGHQFRLGHYYRNIFQNINFINNQIYLTYDEKYSYIKLLRVHFSNYEQILLFLNSISSIGRKWELDNYDEINKGLITKYNLVKNIPNEKIINCILAKDYYPLINYEVSEINPLQQRKKIIKKYK